MTASMRRQLLPQELRKKRKKIFVWKIGSAVIAVLIFFIGVGILSRIHSVRVTEFYVNGAKSVDGEAIRTSVEKAISGNYAFIFPKNNTLLLSKTDIRHRVLQDFPAIKAINSDRSGTRGLTITVAERAAHALWCSNLGECYHIDDSGFVFQRSLSGEQSSSTPLVRYLLPLAVEGKNGSLGGRVLPEAEFRAFDALRKPLLDLNFSISSVGLYGEEDIEMVLSDGKRVLLPRGESFQKAVNNLALVIASDVFISGKEVEYIDVRFGNKVFYKEE